MVQGRNYENFALNYLKPFFTEKIEAETDTITKINEDVKGALGGAKAVRKTYNCPQCDTKTVTNSHTKPGLSSPNKAKMIKMNDEIVATIPNKIETKMMVIDSESEDTKKNVRPLSSLETQVPLVEDLESCTYCEFDTESVIDLNKHIEIVHGIVKSDERKQFDEQEEENRAIQISSLVRLAV